MCEIPSNVILAEEFAERFDGFSIGSNDLTQLTLGVDRDSAELEPVRREDEAVKWMIRTVIETAHRRGQGRPVRPGAERSPGVRRVPRRRGIDSVSVTADSFVRVKANVAREPSASAGRLV